MTQYNITTSQELQNILPIAARNMGHWDVSKNSYVGNPIESLDDVVYYVDNEIYPTYQVFTNSTEYTNRLQSGQAIQYNIGLLTHGLQPVINMAATYNIFNMLNNGRLILGFKYYCMDPGFPGNQLFRGYPVEYRSNNGVGSGVYWEMNILGADYGYNHSDDYGFVYSTDIIAVQYVNGNAGHPIPIGFEQWRASSSVLAVPIACVLFNDQLYDYYPTIDPPIIDTGSGNDQGQTNDDPITNPVVYDPVDDPISGGDPAVNTTNDTSSTTSSVAPYYYPIQQQQQCEERVIEENITYNFCIII